MLITGSTRPRTDGAPVIDLTADGRNPVIATKLFPPPLPRTRVERPRLHAALDTGVEGPMTLISGLAGSGKTTLCASWLAAQPGPASVAWVTLETRDRNAARFWAHVLAAIGSTPAGHSRQLAGLPPPRTAGDEAFLSRFIEAVSGLARPLVLFLDDERESGGREVDRIIERLAWLAPPAFRLVLATRRSPHMPLARLRAGGKVSEIGGDDLAFTEDEAAALGEGLGIGVSREGVRALVERTEGLAVAVRLGLEVVADAADPEDAARTFDGSHPLLAEYLEEELLAPMPREQRRFLLRTSVADRLTPDLAEELGGEDAQTHLAAIRRGSTLVASLETGWFRYHRLVTELLRARLAEESQETLAGLHVTAAAWLAARGDARGALEQALAAKDAEMVATILSDMEIWPLLTSDGAALRGVIDRLPRGELAGHPDSLVAVAASRVVEGDRVEALALLRSWQRSSRAPHAPHQRIRAAIVGLTAARRSGDVGATLRWSRRAVRQGDVDISEVEADRLRAVLLEHRGWAMWCVGDLDQARRDLGEGHRAARWIGDDALHLSCHSLLAACELRAGRVSAAADLANEALAFAAERDMGSPPESALALFVLAAVHGKRGELDAMETMLESGREVARGGDIRDESLRAMEARIRARVDRWHGNPDVAANLLSATRRRVQRDADLGRLAHDLCVEEAEMCLAGGRPDAAEQLLAAEPGGGLAEATVRSRLALARGRTDAALAGIEAALEAASPNDVPALAAACVLRAILHRRAGDHATAWEATEHALMLSEADGIAYPFLFEDEARDLLWSQLGRGTGHEEWALTLLDRIDSRHPASRGAGLAESLSERERTVLRYMDTLMSVSEISRELFVSTNTVKTHVKHIYRKLGVSRRRDAVERGRALHLLDGHSASPGPVPARLSSVAGD